MSTTPSSYRALLAVPGIRRLLGSMLLARTATQMGTVVLVLFVLDRYHSPQLAGIAVMASVVPGLLLSPLAGAVLDRGARVPLVCLDYLAVTATTTVLVVLALAGTLPPWLLVLLLVLGSVTQPLSNSGVRSLLPLIVPRHMWDRANAADSGGYVVATVVGPGVAGAVVALAGATLALLLPAALLLSAAALIVGMQVPRPDRAPSSSLLRDAWAGLGYVMRSRGLRGLAATVTIYNVANGAVTVVLPVLVLTRLHGSSVQVGLLFAVMGAAGIVAGLATGRVDSEGIERELMSIGCAGTVAGLVLLALAPSLPVAAAAMAVVGLANGPLDIGLFSLRQRVTEPAWFGRAFAVSMSLNFVGYPIGSSLAGPLVAHSASLALGVAAGFAAAATVAALLLVPGGGRLGRARRHRTVAGRAQPR